MFEDTIPLILETCDNCSLLTNGNACDCVVRECNAMHDANFADIPDDVEDDFPMYLEYDDWKDDGYRDDYGDF